MRIKNTDDLKMLGPHARKQIENAMAQAATNPHDKSLVDPLKKPTTVSKKTPAQHEQKKRFKQSRIKTTSDGLAYCPYPSTDPFVKVHQRLEAAYGLYSNGGLLVTEMIVDGGESDWRFDFAILPPISPASLKYYDESRDSDGVDPKEVFVGQQILLIEADGFGFHRSKKAFKNDRAKQTHALKQGFVVKRITNEDARHRLDHVMQDIEKILAHQKIYQSIYHVFKKGKTQSVFSWCCTKKTSKALRT